MPQWTYRARDSLGVSIRGELEAQDREQLEDALWQRGLRLVRARRRRMAPQRLLRLPRRVMPSLLRDLATLDESGVPILTGLQDLRSAERPRSGTALVLQELENNVRRGHHYCMVAINGRILEFKAFDLEGRLFDRMKIEKR